MSKLTPADSGWGDNDALNQTGKRCKGALLSRRDSINQKSEVITFISQSAQGSVPLRCGFLPAVPFISDMANTRHTSSSDSLGV